MTTCVYASVCVCVCVRVYISPYYQWGCLLRFSSWFESSCAGLCHSANYSPGDTGQAFRDRKQTTSTWAACKEVSLHILHSFKKKWLSFARLSSALTAEKAIANPGRVELKSFNSHLKSKTEMTKLTAEQQVCAWSAVATGYGSI